MEVTFIPQGFPTPSSAGPVLGGASQASGNDTVQSSAPRPSQILGALLVTCRLWAFLGDAGHPLHAPGSAQNLEYPLSQPQCPPRSPSTSTPHSAAQRASRPLAAAPWALNQETPPSPSLSITPPSQCENMNNGPGTGKQTLGLEPDGGKSLNGGSGLFMHRKQGHRRSRKAHKFPLKGQRREPAFSEPRALAGRAHGSQGPRGPGICWPPCLGAGGRDGP